MFLRSRNSYGVFPGGIRHRLVHGVHSEIWCDKFLKMVVVLRVSDCRGRHIGHGSFTAQV
jgi:hypothetical protein